MKLSDFGHYLAAKKSVDDRALNPTVFQQMIEQLQKKENNVVLEIGAGIGTMLVRWLERIPDLRVDYTLMDVSVENIESAYWWISDYARQNAYLVQQEDDLLILSKSGCHVRVCFLIGDVYDLDTIEDHSLDGVVANAFFDLVNPDTVLPEIYRKVVANGWLYASINFDGETIFIPELAEDQFILELYHRSMDERMVNNANSAGRFSGRKLYTAFQHSGAKICAMGASDWVVFPQQNQYALDEAYFLHFILQFFAQSVLPVGDLSQETLMNWLSTRHEQIKCGELTFITHQLDYLVEINRKLESK
ncbi:MAG: hypothetical protein CVU39_06590 [Chloroflexi bacterium HGW-Chloroflexi-10]|nr:MAG: hypothetical protein CVU39_06590 [Chloroflexi bacterium HGW-Chloroflexi-10]